MEVQLLASHGVALIGLLPPRPLGAETGKRSVGQWVFAMRHSDRIMSMREALALMRCCYDNMSDETAQTESGYGCGTDGDWFAISVRLCSPEFRWDAGQGVTSATTSSFEELPTLVDYIHRRICALEVMADLFETYTNSLLA